MSSKFLADVRVAKCIIDLVTHLGYNIKWVAIIDKSMDDEEVLKLSEKENRILLTNDKDFGELVFHQRKISKGIILLRIKRQNSKEKAVLLKKLLEEH